MKHSRTAALVAAFAVGVITAGGLAWGGGSSNSLGSIVCQTPAGYLRVAVSGDCKRRETQVDLPRGEQGLQGEIGPQGADGADGRDGSDANVDSIRCFQRLTRQVDLHHCVVPANDLADGADLTGANLSDAVIEDLSPTPLLGESRGYGHCAVAGAQLSCWGGLGDASSVPSELDASQVVDVQTGVQTSCALLRSGALRCWGSAGYGQNSTPSDLGSVAQLAMGDVHTCALTKAGSVRCWGITRAAIQQVPSNLGTVRQLVSGGDFACTLNDAGVVNCWGWVPAVPDSLPKIVKLHAGYNSVCGIDERGFAHCWGTDSVSLGNDFPGDLGQVKALTGGVGGMCAINASDMARCWGGYVGNINGYRDGSETRVPADLGTVRSISMGVFHTCAITTSNQLRCWGNDQAASTNVTFAHHQAKLMTLDGANITGKNLTHLPLAKGSSACGLVGEPKSLPEGWSLVNQCLVR